MEGPYRYHGTMRGEQVRGFAFYERSLALYRDWELLDVLASTLDGDDGVIGELRGMIAAGKRSEARTLLQDRASTLTPGGHDVTQALIEVLSAES